MPQGGPALLFPAERWLFAMGFGLVAAIALLSATLGQAVGWAGIAASMQFGLVALILGMVFRWRECLPRLSLGLVVLGHYLVTTPLFMVLSYMRFPLESPTIDPLLERVDGWLGYSWPEAVAAAAAHPVLAHLMRLIYLSSLPQLLMVLVLLAGMGRRVALHRFMLVSALSLATCIAIWAAAPSFGPSILHAIPPEIQHAVRLFTDARFTAELNRLAAEGNAVISVGRLGGNVAFPSFHIVMALLVVWFTRGTVVFPVALIANLVMVPATLVHGGHHLIDLLGGTAVFLAALVVACRLVPDAEEARPLDRAIPGHIPSDAL